MSPCVVVRLTPDGEILLIRGRARMAFYLTGSRTVILFTPARNPMKKTKFHLIGCGLVLLVAMGCSDDVLTENEDIRGGRGDGQEGDGDSGNDGDGDGSEVQTDLDCNPGAVLGCAGEDALEVCGEDGTGSLAQTCPSAEPYCLLGSCSDQICVPGRSSCRDADHVEVCNEDGTGYEPAQACADGTICQGGVCEESCDLGVKMVSSYFGCEYWTVFLDQYDESGLPLGGISANQAPHAVVISNPNDRAVTVSFQSFEVGVSIAIDDPVVPPMSSRAFTMPRMNMEETGVFQRGVFVRSTLPVTAHQFNPLNNESVYSNDASLLLPVSSLGTKYYAMSWPTQVLMNLPGSPFGEIESQHAFITIVAASPGFTNVVVNSKAVIAGSEEIGQFPPGVGRNFELAFGDVLNLRANSGQLQGENDLTGTLIASDKPVAVFAGHEQAVIGYDSSRDSCCADHVEQQLFPVDSWGKRYVAAFSPGRTQTKDHWRILAGEDNVTVTTNPPQPGANNVMLNAGEFVSFFSDQNFEVNGTGKISVGQFLASQEQTEEVTGDPAFLLAVPLERMREDYVVLTPENYTRDFLTIIRPAGEAITLDGSGVDSGIFVAVGSGEFEVGTVEVSAGVHSLEAAVPFAVNAYGYDQAVSYGYPGGLNVVGEEDE